MKMNRGLITQSTISHSRSEYHQIQTRPRAADREAQKAWTTRPGGTN
jgi:hypothetical protein